MAITLSERLQRFLGEVKPAIVGTTRRDGSVQLNPAWYELADGYIWLNGGPNRAWLKHLQRDGRVTLLFLDPNNMFRWAQIQGRLVDVTAEGADEHINRLAQRYTGGPYRSQRAEDPRLKIRVQPERVTGGDSMQSWD